MIFVIFPLWLLTYFIYVFNFCLSCVFLLYPAWDSLCFLDLVDYLPSHISEVFSYYLFKYFLRSFLSSFSFWDPCNENVGAFKLSQRSLRLSLFLFILFSIFCSVAVISTILSSMSFICSSASVILLLILSSALFTQFVHSLVLVSE